MNIFVSTQVEEKTMVSKEDGTKHDCYALEVIIEKNDLEHLSNELGYEITPENLPAAFIEWINSR